jgi:glycosyltransferase involved in cell wall biosynthesis
MNPSCTILIPTWNRGDYLLRALESALAQGDFVEKIIVMDNKSDYEFQKYLNVARSLSTKISIYVQPVNVGATSNWLSGLRKVNTEWVKILFSDDFLEPNCLERMFLFQEEFDLDVLVCCAFGLVNGLSYEFYNHPKMVSGNFTNIAESVADRIFPVSPTAALLRTMDAISELEELYTHPKLLKSAIGPDLLMIYGPVARGNRFGFLDERLVTMFGDGKNISSQQENLLAGYYAEAFLHLTAKYQIDIVWRLRFRLWFRMIRSAWSTR